MVRRRTPRETMITAQARRANALQRLDLREPTSPRESAAGVTSHAVKTMDPASATAIAAFLSREEWDK